MPWYSAGRKPDGREAAAVGRQHHERREVLVLGPEPVGDPRAHRRPRQNHAALMEHAARLLVIRIGREHRPDDAQLVGHGRQVRQQLAHLDAALAVLRERELASACSPAVVRSVRRSAVAGRCPAYFISAGFGSHRSTCDGPPVMNSRMTCLAFGAKCGPTVCAAGGERVIGQQIGEAEHAEAAAHDTAALRAGRIFYGQKITSLVESSACA